MVPEVLLALLGVPGEVITLVPATSDGGRERFRVSPDLPFLEPPERAKPLEPVHRTAGTRRPHERRPVSPAINTR
mgnify:CR=1 FL=1